MLKCCPRCQEHKPMDLFGVDRHNKDGLTNACAECRRVDRRKWYANNTEKARSTALSHYYRNRVAMLDANKCWRAQNSGHLSDYRKTRRPMMAQHSANRRAMQSKATPIWADKQAIVDAYMESAYFGMHVDHIVPINSEIVCGLHVFDNLQLLEKSENLSKQNRFWPDMP